MGVADNGRGRPRKKVGSQSTVSKLSEVHEPAVRLVLHEVGMKFVNFTKKGEFHTKKANFTKTLPFKRNLKIIIEKNSFCHFAIAAEPCCVCHNVMIPVRLMGLQSSVSHTEAEISVFQIMRNLACAKCAI